MKEDHIIWSDGRMQMKEVNQLGPSFLLKWSCANKKMN